MVASIGANVSGQGQSAFLSDPAISPDGSKIVFVYESDLWMAYRTGGTAHRITAMTARNLFRGSLPTGSGWHLHQPRTERRCIHNAVEGGCLKQLTWHDGNDFPDSWSWDSKLSISPPTGSILLVPTLLPQRRHPCPALL